MWAIDAIVAVEQRTAAVLKMTPGPDWVTDDWTVGGLNEDAGDQDFEHPLAFTTWADGLQVGIKRPTTNGDARLRAVDRTKILQHIAQESTVVAV